MGADGHIEIFDYSKFEQEFDSELIKEFLNEFLSSVMYIQSLEDRRYITRYNGSNLDCSDTFDVVLGCYMPATDEMNTKVWIYSKWEADRFMKFPKSKRKLYYRMLRFLVDNCELTSWEVWT